MNLKYCFYQDNKGEKPVTEESGSIPKSCVESLGPTIGNYQALPDRPHE